MHIALLGELEVLDDDMRDIVVTGAKLRALLAVLALHAGRAVPADQLVDALWGGDPPIAVRNGLQGLISKLRRALGSPSLVAMRGGGYALDLPPEAIDVLRFEQLVAEGRATAARATSPAQSTFWPRRTRCGEATRSPSSPMRNSRRLKSAGYRNCASPRSRSDSTWSFNSGDIGA
jgi:DNA-binding winged helix-turn-helix (wHTH) protein